MMHMKNLKLTTAQRNKLNQKVISFAKEGFDNSPVALNNINSSLMNHMITHNPEQVNSMVRDVVSKFNIHNGELTNNVKGDGARGWQQYMPASNKMRDLANALDNIKNRSGGNLPRELSRASSELRKAANYLGNKRNTYIGNIYGVLDGTWKGRTDGSRNQDGTEKSWGDKTVKKVKDFLSNPFG